MNGTVPATGTGGTGGLIPGSGPGGAAGQSDEPDHCRDTSNRRANFCKRRCTSATLNSGGGAGGGIKISTATFAGAGAISANGGAGNNLGGGGGGGRIAITLVTNSFSGSITAFGGAGANYGGAGTIYLAQDSAAGSLLKQQVFVDNGGASGTNAQLSGVSGIFDLSIKGRASLINAITTPLTNGNLFVGSNCTFVEASTSRQLLTVLTNATIQTGGVISDDGVITGGSGIGHLTELNFWRWQEDTAAWVAQAFQTRQEELPSPIPVPPVPRCWEVEALMAAPMADPRMVASAVAALEVHRERDTQLDGKDFH